MKISDSIKTLLLSAINEFAADPNTYAVNPEKDFSRNRKLGIHDLISMLLTMEGDCTKEEIYRYFGRTTSAPSKAAFCKQRQKLKPDSLRSLLFSFNNNLSVNLYNGKYQLVACDGSAADIFRNPNDPDTFFEPSGCSTKGFNQIYMNFFYSILDRRFTDIVIQPGRKRNEYSAFCEMVDNVGRALHAIIYIGDRGYASYNNYAHIIEQGQYFMIRCTDAKTEKLLGFSLDGVKELDFHVDRILSRSQSKKKRLQPEKAEQYRYVYPDVPMDFITEEQPEYEISLRVVRVEIEKGKFINLITNLLDLEFDMEDLKDLYHLRWSEENAFRDIKYPLCLEAFHSKKYDYIIQEVWARAILHNCCSEITAHVPIEQHDTKLVYQVNFSEGAKICRDFLRNRDPRICFDVEGLIAQNIEAIRPNRTFERRQRFKAPMSFCYRS